MGIIYSDPGIAFPAATERGETSVEVMRGRQEDEKNIGGGNRRQGSCLRFPRQVGDRNRQPSIPGAIGSLNACLFQIRSVDPAIRISATPRRVELFATDLSDLFVDIGGLGISVATFEFLSLRANSSNSCSFHD